MYEWFSSFSERLLASHKVRMTNSPKRRMNTIEGYDVKNFTDMVDENAMRQIKQLLSINFFADKKDQDYAGRACWRRLCNRFYRKSW